MASIKDMSLMIWAKKWYEAHGGGSKPEQSKTVTATTSTQAVTPDTGYTLSSVTVNPQSHSETYTPFSNTAQNDMGENHNYRYVDTSGMYVPYGSKSITQNGTHDVAGKATVEVNVSLSKTRLWTNPDTSVAFPSSVVTLNGKFSDYDYVSVGFVPSITTQSATILEVIIPTSWFGTTGEYTPVQPCFSYAFTNGLFIRYFWADDIDPQTPFGTTIKFSSATSGSTTDNEKIIPCVIYGVK